MSQIIESRFRVFGFDKDDVEVSDIEDVGWPVHVNKDREEYSESLSEKIDTLEVGNVIRAELQSESVTIQDGVWKFLELEIVNESRFHFIENADNHTSQVERLVDSLESIQKPGLVSKITSGGEVIGFITVSEDKGDKFWRELNGGLNSHELQMNRMSQISDPPYEAIYTRSSNNKWLIFYHFGSLGTNAASAIVNANSESE